MVEFLGIVVEVFECFFLKQMFIYYKDGYIEGLGIIGLIVEYIDFYEMLCNKGVLIQCEYVVVSNGLQIGIGQGFNVGVKFFDIEGLGVEFVVFVGQDLFIIDGFWGVVLGLFVVIELVIGA